MELRRVPALQPQLILKMEDEKVSALDERLTLLEERIFGPAEKDAEYPKVWNCCWGSFVGWGKGRPEGYRSTSWEWPGLPNAGMPVSNARGTTAV